MDWTWGNAKLVSVSSAEHEELSQLYALENEDIRRQAARRGLWIGVTVYLLFSITDIILIPDVAREVVLARLVVGLVGLTVLEWLIRVRAGAVWVEGHCAATIVAAYAGWLVFAVGTSFQGAFSHYMVYAALFMMSANLFFSFRFGMSLVTSLIILAVFLVALVMVPSDALYVWALAVFGVSCLVFTCYVNYRLNEERFKVFLNAREAKMRHREAIERGSELLKLSRTDPLTGLDNRRAIDERLGAYWDIWRDQGVQFSVLLIDVDFFKRYNDQYGHQGGDRCLAALAEALHIVVDGHDATIGRYGGEEFIVLAPATDEQGALLLAERIRSTVERLAMPHENRRDGVAIVTVSIGIATAREQAGVKVERIVHEADRALYLAKAEGRNGVHLFDPTDPHSSDESENIAALLKIAIKENLVSMVYQPIESIKTGRVNAVESLMRLRMLDGAKVPPSLFIPVAERTGAIRELGYWAIDTVCRDMLASGAVEVASVNVSPLQLQSAEFASTVKDILARNGVEGSRLALEITEGHEMEMHSNVLRCIADLKRLGIRIWLDDFGTGFAGLSWLRLIEFDMVKIDRSFVHDSSSPKGARMLRDIITLIRHRGPLILVEGIETAEQLQFVNELGLDLGQGYFLGYPAPADEILCRAGANGKTA